MLRGKDGVGGNEHPGFGVLEHIEQAVVGIFAVHGHIGSTGLVNGEHCEQELFLAGQHDSYEGVGSDFFLLQVGGEDVGEIVQLAVGEAAGGVGHGNGLGARGGVGYDHIDEGLVGVIGQFLATREGEQIVALFGADDADGGQRLVGGCHHGEHTSLDGFRHLGQEVEVIELLARLYADIVLSINLIDDAGQLGAGVALGQIGEGNLLLAQIQVFCDVAALIAEGDTLRHFQVAAEV